MFSRTWSSTTIGISALLIEVEAHVSPGMPKYTVVGLPDGAVRESKQRIYSALVTNNLPVPRGIVNINLAPANVRKEGTAFDLPMAIALFAATSGLLSTKRLEQYCLIGELALDGRVRPVRGALSMALQVRESGKHIMIVPKGNEAEVSVVDDVTAYGVSHLMEAISIIDGSAQRKRPIAYQPINTSIASTKFSLDFADVKGQESVKRSLEIAASGGHNVIMIGPPGSGKTMLARRLPSILPPLSAEESLETTRIHSVGGRLQKGGGLITHRPFRAPHHTVSDAGLCGGGANPRPGDISLANNGILFLDEMPEFKRSVLEVLRQPLEEGMITISRSQMTVDYPARFMLVAGMNPCPCGHKSNPRRKCICSHDQVQRYLSRISGPLLDRIDIHIEVEPVSFEDITSLVRAESSAVIRKRVRTARRVQTTRFEKTPGVHANSQMNTQLVQQHCQLSEESQSMMKAAVDMLGLSARAFDRILKVSRTIADLDASENISTPHLAEAIQYRSLDRKMAEYIS